MTSIIETPPGNMPDDVFVDPDDFLREQGEKHAHVQVHQLAPRGSGHYLVIGYDADWNEAERTALNEAGRVLRDTDYPVPHPLEDQENRDAS